MQIDDVGCPRTIDIGQTDSFLIEVILGIEPGGIIHCYFGPEPSVAEIRPVTDFSVANTDDVSEVVAGKVREKNSLSGVCKGDHRPFFFIARLANPDRLPEALLLQR